LIGVSRDLLIAVVPGRVARPDHEVYFVLYVFLDPLESGIYEREWRIAIGVLGAVRASSAIATVAGLAG
jgi:hypothetical protein